MGERHATWRSLALMVSLRLGPLPRDTMRRTDAKTARQRNPYERRKLPRKKALLSAVLSDVDGGSASDCVIRDTTATSAQISCTNTPAIGARVYLLDANNKAAHLARVVWCCSGRAGLAFIESHAIGKELRPG